MLDLTSEEWKQLQPAIAEAVKIIESTDLNSLYQGFLKNPLNAKSAEYASNMIKHIGLGKKPDAYNFGVNDGRAAGRTVDHFHLHIIPRYEGDVPDAIGGVRHIIPGKGNYKK